jgi:hypothetical protein
MTTQITHYSIHPKNGKIVPGLFNSMQEAFREVKRLGFDVTDVDYRSIVKNVKLPKSKVRMDVLKGMFNINEDIKIKKEKANMENNGNVGNFCKPVVKPETTYYKMIKSHFINPKALIPINSILVKTTHKRFTKNGKELKLKFECYCQGVETKMTESSFDYLIENNLIVEIDKPNDEILFGYVLESNDYIKRKKLLNKARKTFPQYESQLTTLFTWVFSTKGSTAVTFNDEIKFQKDKENILKDLKSNGGYKAKPGSPVKNRATRQTVISNENDWDINEDTLLPFGIRKSDSCSYQESVKIFDKLVTEVISMLDTPSDLIKFFNNNGYIQKKEYHIDYFYKTPISWNLFEQNTHHGKVKGLEFCHIDTELEFNTIANNVTIGLCESNRHQGGYSIDYTEKKILIKKIIENEFNSDVKHLNELSINELENIYYNAKFKK